MCPTCNNHYCVAVRANAARPTLQVALPDTDPANRLWANAVLSDQALQDLVQLDHHGFLTHLRNPLAAQQLLPAFFADLPTVRRP